MLHVNGDTVREWGYEMCRTATKGSYFRYCLLKLCVAVQYSNLFKETERVLSKFTKPEL
jgi:hypothetical protein